MHTLVSNSTTRLGIVWANILIDCGDATAVSMRVHTPSESLRIHISLLLASRSPAFGNPFSFYCSLKMPTRDLAVIDLTESSPPRSRSAVLVDAITTAPDERVRAALRLGCELSKEVEQMVQNMLLVPVDRVSSKIVEKDADSDGYVKEVGSDEEEEDDDKSSEDESDGKECENEGR